MNQPGKYIVYLFFGLFAAVALMSACSDSHRPDDPGRPTDRISLSISFHAPQQTDSENGLRANEGGGIDKEVFKRESAVYSLAVLVFKDGSNELDGKKFIDRELVEITGTSYKDYRELDVIEGIEVTAGIRNVHIVANAPDGHFNDVVDFSSFCAKVEELSNQGMYDHPVGGTAPPGDTPIGGEDPDDRFTNLVMSQSFTGLPLNSGIEKYFLGYTGNGDLPVGGNGMLLLENGNPIKVELVRLVARVAIQKITFNLPATMEFEPGVKTTLHNHFVDTVFLLNAKRRSSYFPEDNAFVKPVDAFIHGNTPGYDFLKGKFSGIAEGSGYAGYLYIPIHFEEYDIKGNHAPLWFYAFENKDSGTSPTCFVIGVKYQYKQSAGDVVKTKKVYYPVVVNANGSSYGADHDFIKRNNQYGIKVTIKGLGSYMTDYPGLRSVPLQAVNTFSEEEGVLEIEETAGPNLFPWTGNVYK